MSASRGPRAGSYKWQCPYPACGREIPDVTEGPTRCPFCCKDIPCCSTCGGYNGVPCECMSTGGTRARILDTVMPSSRGDGDEGSTPMSSTIPKNPHIPSQPQNVIHQEARKTATSEGNELKNEDPKPEDEDPKPGHEDPKSDPKSKAEADSKPDPKPDPKPENEDPKPDPKPKSEDPESKNDPKPENEDRKPDSNSKDESKNDDPKPNNEPDPNSKDEAGPRPDRNPENEDPKPDPKPKNEDPESKNDPKPENEDRKPDSNSKDEPKNDDPKPNNEPDPNSKDEAGPRPDRNPENEDPKPNNEDPKIDPKPNPKPKIEVDLKQDAKPKPDGNTKPKSEDPKTDAEPDAKNENPKDDRVRGKRLPSRTAREDEALYEGTDSSKRKKRRNETPRTRFQDVEGNTTGLNPPPSKKIDIIFHVLIPTNIWGWNEKCRVHLRFGHIDLGKWNESIGDFVLMRKSNGLSEFRCEIAMDIDIVKRRNGVPYKYCVINSHYEDEFEYLHGLPTSNHGVRNRCLKIEPDYHHGGVLYQYDSVAYPHVESGSKVVQFLKKGWSWFTGWTSATENEIALPSQDVIQSEALNFYLEAHKYVLCNFTFPSSFKANIATNETMNIFNALSIVTHCVEDYKCEIFRCSKLREVMMLFLLDIVEKLCLVGVNGNSAINGKRMLSAIITACCLHEMCPKFIKLSDVPPDHVSALLSLLRLMPDVQNQKCVDWEYARAYIPDTFVKAASSAVLALTVHLSHTEYFNLPDWMFAIPVIHFLRTDSVPFQEIEYDPKKIPWRDRLLGLEGVRSQTNNRDMKIVDNMFEKLKLLTEADPLLLYGFVYICPRGDFENLISKIHPFFPMAFVANELKQLSNVNTNEIQMFTSFMIAINHTLTERSRAFSQSFQMQKGVLASGLYLVEQTLLKIGSRNTDGCLKWLNQVVTVFLRSIEFFEDMKEDFITESVCKVCSCLGQWILKSQVFYFGASAIHGSTIWHGGCAASEIKAWNILIPVDVQRKEVLKLWQTDVVDKIIRQRIKKVHFGKRIDLFVTMDSIPSCHSIVTNALMDAVMEAINTITTSDVDRLLFKSTSQKKNVGKIIDKILARQYPGETREVSFGELLKWDMWQTFIKIHSNQAMVASLSEFQTFEKCLILCTSAASVLENMCTLIKTGGIKLAELSLMKEREEHLKKLLLETSPNDQFKILNQCLDQRFREQQQFSERLKHLKQFCQCINIEVQGLGTLLAEIEYDYSSASINSLCHCIGGDTVFISLQSAQPLHDIVKDFDTMISSQSRLFQDIWRRHMRNAEVSVRRKERDKLNIEDIKTLIWDKTFGECTHLLDTLHDRSIQLTEVDHYFMSIQDMKWELQSLIFGVQKCINPSRPCSLHWIDDVIQHIRHYWTSLTLSKAAAVVIILKTKLCLTGDFRAIETLANQATVSQANRPLSSIDKSLIDAGSFLSEHMGDSGKLKCLEAFADSFKIVDWIRKETPKGIGDLHKFVSVALHTSAGEGDFANDNLSRLKIVGSGYAPLIYDLQMKPNFDMFKTCCVKVWNSLQQTPSLPAKLRSCNGDVEWYKSVKDTQASVEITSYGQMNNIFECGCYKIGIKQPVICQSHSEVISLTLIETGEKRLAKKRYSLEELRDLESKLVLITGRNAEKRKMVDLFLDTFHSVCHIAELLIELQQVGNVKYTGWILQVPCSRNGAIIDSLQGQAKKMERELKDWKETVSCARHEFYELNYYTTVQLLTLRRELSMEKLSSDIASHVLFLLQSISSQVSTAVVRQVVKNVTSSVASDFDQEPALRSEGAEVATVLQPETTSAASVAAEDSPTSIPQPVSCEDMPKLKETDLNDNERKILEFVTRVLDCSRFLVLKAFEKFRGNDMDRYDYRDWCNENMDAFEFEEEDASSSEEEDDATSSSDESEVDYTGQVLDLYSTGSPEVKDTSMEASTSFDIITMQSEMQEPVDEDHATVKELVSAGYTVDQSIDAVEKFDTLDSAMEYLDQQVLDEDDEQDLIPSRPRYNQQASNDDQVLLEDFKMTWHHDGPPTIHADAKAEERYLNLEQLGRVLQILSQVLPGEVQHRRSFSSQFLKDGCPNLLVVDPDLILRSTLSLYMENSYHPLPTPEEVLLCNSTTTAEEVELFWMRAIADPQFRRLFCLVHAEKLSYQVSDQALRSRSLISQGKQGYRLVIICSNEEEEKSHFISKLHHFRRPFIPRIDLQEYRNFLAIHFTGQTQSTGTSASCVDFEQSCVRFVMSDRSGMGKSLYIKRLAESLTFNLQCPAEVVHVTIPLHGPVVTPDSVLELFQEHANNATCCIYHIDIAPKVLWQVDTILFSLLILRGLCDSQGRMWRCHPNQFYAVEVTLPNRDNIPERDKKFNPESRTMSLMKIMPSVSCASPRKVLNRLATDHMSDSFMLMDTEEFSSDPYQRVYQYIQLYATRQNLDDFTFTGVIRESPKDCLQLLLQSCGVKDPSWSEIRHFVQFLNLQLKSCEESVFTDSTLVGDVMAGLKGFVVKFMMRMSRDFSTSSLRGEVSLEMNEAVDVNDIDMYQIAERKLWEQSPHPYIFFNQDRMSITFVGFMVTKQGDLVDPTYHHVLERGIMNQQLYSGLIHNRVNFQDDYRRWTKPVMIEKISMVMGVDYPYDPDETYVLTVDNVIKILAIQMRFRCGIPVVIMGETGCGKTRLIRYMCDLARQGMDKNNMIILKVHGGTTEEDIARFIQQAERESVENQRANIDTVVFFDEANTTDAIGLIKEIMCDRRINGRPISDDLKFIAACNPYKKHDEEMIKRLESAGLGFFVHASETQQKLGNIPLRQLVYRVLDLPPSMRPLVYDFGQLNTDTESDYIRQIVSDHINCHPQLKRQLQQLSRPIADVLAYSQKYMRERKDECSFVSLRDVERAMIVFEYLYGMMDVFGPLMDQYAYGERRLLDNQDDDDEDFEDYESPGDSARALVLSLSVCYHARLENREEYEEGVVGYFTGPIELVDGADQFRDEMRWCQEVLLDNMHLGDNIARNAALRENVFMMAICIELRIPLFLVGKPGSSKSLAKAIVSESMRGKDSRNELLTNFKEVEIFSYQCSQLSTPESVIEVFNNASKFQAKQDMKSYVAVVVLDEVGLAEDSPNLPLKALHPLLEDGTEGAKKDFTDQIISRQERVAFIGISNWALDPAKMNRGVMVTRADPSEEELVFSAKGICGSNKDDPIRQHLEKYFKPFAKAYKNICAKQKREFFGLRDFYSLIKMLYHMCQKSNRLPTWPQLEHAIKRNFGGLETKELDPFNEFQQLIHINRNPDLSDVPPELQSVVNPDCSRLGLIKTSLGPQEKTWHGENRYILFLTENYAALDILKNPKSYLEEGLSMSGGDGATSDVQPFILFGSSFPKDKEYTQVCRNINQIKICMETGRTVILLNLDNLYESLYDVLNQYYIYHADSKYVDLGLQTHRVKCRVHNNFKLILIAEKDTVYEKFPTPLINRLEKHFVLTSSILREWQKAVLNKLEEWITKFANESNSEFRRSDAFIGFQKDTPASVVFQASNLLRSATTAVREGLDVSGGKWEQVFLWSQLRRDHWDIDEVLNQDLWNEAVLMLSKYLLLLTASPDAIVRLKETELVDEKELVGKTYFEQQHHNCIEDYLEHHVHGLHGEPGLLMQVTTHSHLLSQDELELVQDGIKMKIASFFLHEFDTELDFSNKVGPMFKISEGYGQEQRLVIIQCDSGHLNGDLIACARYRIYDLRAKADDKQTTHLLFIIHLPQHVANSSFVGFQGDPWNSSHIDDLRPTSGSGVSAYEAIGLTISELFLGCPKSQARGNNGHFAREGSKGEVRRQELLAQGNGDPSVSRDQLQSGATAIREDWAERVQTQESEEMEISSQASESPKITVDDVEGFEFEDLQPREENNATVPGVSPKPNKALLEIVGPCHDEKSLPVRSPLFRRLHGCIQAAASRLKDFGTKRSTKRVEILVHLIPKEPLPVPDPNQFHGVLINHMSEVLEERDIIREDKEWVVKEAMNRRSLQHGGTFRNALSRKVDDVIIPIFSEIIASIDQNYNLDLIDPKNGDPLLSQFWLSMFREGDVMQFSYTDMITPREQVPGVGGRKAQEDYKCHLPFSWLIHKAVDSQWENAKTSSGDDKLLWHKQLCEAVEATAVGEVLRGVKEFDCDDLYGHYLHDFVRLEHRCNHTKKKEYETKEYELIAGSLDALVHGAEYSVDGNITLIHRIAALHIVYEMNQSQVLWFGQLVAHSPEVMIHLTPEAIFNKEEMMLHLCAAEQALDGLVPPLDKDNPASSLIPWLNEVRISQNAITSIINLPSQSETRMKSRQKWEVIRVLQLFLEHVLLRNPFEQSVAYLVRLRLKLKNMRSFLEADTLSTIQKHLNLMEKNVKKKKYFKTKELSGLKRDCHNYFIEVVSTICFGGESAPEPDLIKNLMEVVFTQDVDLISPLTDVKGDKSGEVSVVRSSLLQLLLEHDSESVKEHLEEYFMKSQEALNRRIDENLCLLCIQCFEDALCKRHSGASPESRLRFTIDKLALSCDVLREYRSNPVVTIGYLEGVARMRFAIMEVSVLLRSDLITGTAMKSRLQQRLHSEIMQLVEVVCTDPVINTTDFAASGQDVVGPAVYLLKLLVRQYGFPILRQVSEQHPWIVPEGLHNTDQGKVMDPFVIYKRTINYSSLKESLNEALFGKKVQKLSEVTQNFNVQEATVLLIAIYEAITLGYSNPRRPMDADLLELFNQFAAGVKAFSPAMRRTAQLLLTNQQGGPLAQMTISPTLPPEYKTLGAVVMHTVAVFSSCNAYQLLLPFVNMLTNPSALTNSFLPTMAEDNLQEIKRAMGGQFYECPRGHPYFVGECGRPVEEWRCNICKARIGGVNHRLVSDNTTARNHDTTQTGHALGHPESRTGPPAPERSLSPPAVCIMRALMHSALLWCSCHYLDMMADQLAALVKPTVNPNNLPEFFWMHLIKDIEHLSQVTGKGLDESAIIIHLVLHHILTKEPLTSAAIATVNSLTSKTAREHWEKEFNTHYIQPILRNFNAAVNGAMDLIANDDRQDHDQLFYLTYEKVTVGKDNMEPHLWTYRQRISLEHLGQTLVEKKLKAKHPILHEFLRTEHRLRATQYLPDIVNLQRSLYDAFHHRLDRKDAKMKTFRQFVKELKNENTRNEYNEKIESLKKAWALVGRDLKTHGRLHLEDRYCLPVITEDVPLEYLVPTTTGPGALTFSLVDYLVITHNDFIESCSSKVAENSRGSWDSHKVPITHIHRCHLLDYEHQIVSVVLSHCCYSLKVGKAYTVQYDHQALEKHILDKFIHGKPRILSDIPQVEYRKDIYTTVTFDAVRKRVSPQVRLEPRVKKEILSELRTPDRIRENLDVVDIIIGFLSSGGGKTEKPLGEYVDRVLRMKRRPFSRKAREYCRLQHILSLWEVLSVELARLTWLHKQEPFDSDSVNDKYLRELEDDQVAVLNKCLTKFDLDRLLGALFEFIETYVKYSPDEELKWPLKDVLIQDQFEHLELEPHFSTDFPDSLTLDQTVSLWKHIILYQESIRQY